MDISYEKYRNAVNELVKMGMKNKYGLSFFEDTEEMKKASELKKIMYEYEKQNPVKKETKVIKKGLFKK